MDGAHHRAPSVHRVAHCIEDSSSAEPCDTHCMDPYKNRSKGRLGCMWGMVTVPVRMTMAAALASSPEVGSSCMHMDKIHTSAMQQPPQKVARELLQPQSLCRTCWLIQCLTWRPSHV